MDENVICNTFYILMQLYEELSLHSFVLNVFCVFAIGESIIKIVFGPNFVMSLSATVSLDLLLKTLSETFGLWVMFASFIRIF